MHSWAGAWVNTLFRNEGAGLASELIRAAVAHTRAKWSETPELGMVTFVDPAKVASTNPGWCYLQAGFEHEAWTPKGLRVLRLRPERMPTPEPVFDPQLSFGTLTDLPIPSTHPARAE